MSSAKRLTDLEFACGRVGTRGASTYAQNTQAFLALEQGRVLLDLSDRDRQNLNLSRNVYQGPVLPARGLRSRPLPVH